MKIYKIVFGIMLFLILEDAYSQTQIFSDFDFSNGQYSLYLIDEGEPEELWVRDSLNRLLIVDTARHFYTDDPLVLNQIKSDWIGESVDYFCEIEYDIYLMRKDSLVLKMNMNFEFQVLSVGAQSYQITPEIITKYFAKFKRLKKRFFKCSDFKDGRDFWKKIENDDQFVLKEQHKPSWIDYDGFFCFEYRDTLEKSYTELISQFIKQFSIAFPNEKFDIYCSSKNFKEDLKCIDYLFNVKCKKSLYDKFEMHKKQEWKEFMEGKELWLMLYWRPA